MRHSTDGYSLNKILEEPEGGFRVEESALIDSKNNPLEEVEELDLHNLLKHDSELVR